MTSIFICLAVVQPLDLYEKPLNEWFDWPNVTNTRTHSPSSSPRGAPSQGPAACQYIPAYLATDRTLL